MLSASHSCFIYGIAIRISSGISSRWALYSVYCSFLMLPPGASKTIAMCVGFSFLMTSKMVIVTPKTAEVFIPFELILGVRMKAKCDR